MTVYVHVLMCMLLYYHVMLVVSLGCILLTIGNLIVKENIHNKRTKKEALDENYLCLNNTTNKTYIQQANNLQLVKLVYLAS